MTYAHQAETTNEGEARRALSLVRWNGVFSGSIIGLALFALFDALWLALAYSSHVAAFYQNLDWWIAGTAIAIMAVAGFIAGASSPTRGALPGWMNGMTTWGLLLLAVLLFALPLVGFNSASGNLFVGGHSYVVTFVSYWTAFWAILIGYGAATCGGLAGGLLPRRAAPELAVIDRDESVPARAGTEPTSGRPAGRNGLVHH